MQMSQSLTQVQTLFVISRPERDCPNPTPCPASTKGKHRCSSVHRSKTLLNGVISGWVTIWIEFVYCTPWTAITLSTSTKNVVSGLSFSRSDLVELRPSQFSLRLREKAISSSDITNRAVRAHRHIEIAIA